MNPILMASGPMVVLTALLATAATAAEPTKDIEPQLHLAQKEEAEKRIDELLVERRDTLREHAESRRALVETGAGPMSMGGFVCGYAWALERLTEAELELCQTPEDCVTACEEILGLAGKFEQTVERSEAQRLQRVGRPEIGSSLTVLLARVSRLGAEISLEKARPDKEQDEAKLQSLLVARRAMLAKCGQFREAIWKSGGTGQGQPDPGMLYLAAARRLADAELELGTTPAERIAACQRFYESALRVEKVSQARVTARAAGGHLQKLALARATRIEAEILLHLERVAAGEIEDRGEAELKQLRLRRWQALQDRVDALRAVWNAGVDMHSEGDTSKDYLTALGDLGYAELDLCQTPAQRVTVRSSIERATHRYLTLVEARRAALAAGGTIQECTNAKGAHLKAEIELLRERIRGDYWGPATQPPEIEPPPPRPAIQRPPHAAPVPPAPLPPTPAPGPAAPKFDLAPAPLPAISPSPTVTPSGANDSAGFSEWTSEPEY